MNNYTILGAALYAFVGIAIFAMCLPHRKNLWLPSLLLRCAIWPLIIVWGIWTDFIAPRWR